MAIVYDDSVKSDHTGPMPPYETWKATEKYLGHYENYLYLDFIAKNSTDRKELHQARKELTICERKMEYWKRHPNWNKDKDVFAKIEKLKKQWAR